MQIHWPQRQQLQARAAGAALLSGAAVLAFEPAVWLIGTWYADGYDGVGWVAFALVAALAAWSASSPVVATKTGAMRTYALMALAAGIRLLAQLMDINVIGAVLLAVDVYALAELAQLRQRKRALSPLWLAVLFCFSLPLEPMLQRLAGYDLQQLSAYLACGFLQPFFTDLVCQGVRLQIDGVDVLVDLPCSGTELVSVCALILALINTVRPPHVMWGVLSVVACAITAVLGNGLRIALLAAGIARDAALPFHVMDPIPHAFTGLVVVGMTTLVLFAAMGRLQPGNLETRAPRGEFRSPRQPAKLLFAGLFLPVALLIGALQPQPVDASPRLPPPEIPLVAAGFFRQSNTLTPQEQNYFTRYGGSAARASFGPYGLLVVSTASPLRHLHDPSICLRGMGYRVKLLGTDFISNSTVYRAYRPDPGAVDQSYLVRVSYLSDGGVTARNVSEVVWHWLRAPGSRWTMVQRIVPDHPAVDSASTDLWESAMRRAFNLS